MTRWRFSEFEEDGEAWLKNPVELYAYVDYESSTSGRQSEWRRLMVVTKPWLEKHLRDIEPGGEDPRWVVLPTMLVLPAAEGERLRQLVARVISQGGFDVYSTPAVAE